jgi:hypothetical protein
VKVLKYSNFNREPSKIINYLYDMCPSYPCGYYNNTNFKNSEYDQFAFLEIPQKWPIIYNLKTTSQMKYSLWEPPYQSFSFTYVNGCHIILMDN